METNKIYTISELRQAIKESTEFKARLGDKVESDDKKNNEKAVKDIMKETSEVTDSAKAQPRNTNPEQIEDFNKTTLDVDFAYEPSEDYKERVKAQVHGFPSVENEKNSDVKENDSLDFEGNEEFYSQQADKSEELDDIETDIKHAGLVSHNLDKSQFEDNTIFTESKKIKRLHFKNTIFLSESQMFNKIPDDYKKDGNKFIMKDKTNTEYVIECTVDDRFNLTKFKVLNSINKSQINEELQRMQSLFEYKSSNYFTGTSSQKRQLENDSVDNMIQTIKNLKK